MIIYNSKRPLKLQLQEDIQELENYKELYNNKILECEQGLNYINSLLIEQQCNQITDTLSKNSKDKIKIFSTQISKIDRNLEVLNNLLKDIDNLDKRNIVKSISKYNKKYNEIKTNIAINNLENDMNKNIITKEEVKDMNIIEKSVDENIKAVDAIDNNVNKTETSGIENNDTLLISETLGMVMLPYTAKEVYEILEDKNSKYNTIEDVIADKFTRPLSDYKFQFWARYNETIKLLTERENYKLTESITLAVEMMGKRYLHPAIITACRTLDELDVYLDCLDKNELDDFKIFNIKYELHPILVKQSKNCNKIPWLSKNFSLCKH